VLYQLLTGLLPTEDRRRKTKCALVLRPFFVAPNPHLPALMQARRWQTLYCLVFLISVTATRKQVVACLFSSLMRPGDCACRRVPEDCPQAIQDLLYQCLDRNPDARPTAAGVHRSVIPLAV
jgi:serine/threonine protein kinase